MILAAAAVIAIGALVTHAIEKIAFVEPTKTEGIIEQAVDPGFIDAVLMAFTKLFDGPLLDNTQVYAFSLFKVLLQLDFFIAILMGLIAFESGPNFLSLFINKMFKYGFWTWIAYKWRPITDAILQSFVQVGSFSANAIPKDIMFHPSYLITMGYNLSAGYFKWMVTFKVTDLLIFTWVVRFIIALIASVFIFVSFGLIALNLFLTTVEYYLCASLMLIFLPFAVFDKTERFASQAFSLVISAGTRYMVFCVLVSVIYTYFSEDQSGYSSVKALFLIKGDQPSVSMALFCCFLTGTMAYLCCEAPQMAASVVSGSLHLDSNNAILHAAGAAAIGEKGLGMASNGAAMLGGAAQRGFDAYKAASNAGVTDVKAGKGTSTMGAIGAGLKGFGKGLAGGLAEATVGGMEEAKRVGRAASGRSSGIEELDSNGQAKGGRGMVTRDATGNAISVNGKSIDSKNDGSKSGEHSGSDKGNAGNSGNDNSKYNFPSISGDKSSGGNLGIGNFNKPMS